MQLAEKEIVQDTKTAEEQATSSREQVAGKSTVRKLVRHLSKQVSCRCGGEGEGMEEEQHLGEGMERAACRGRRRRRRRGGRPVGADEHGRGAGGRRARSVVGVDENGDAVVVEHGHGGAVAVARGWRARARWCGGVAREHGGAVVRIWEEEGKSTVSFCARGPTCKWAKTHSVAHLCPGAPQKLVILWRIPQKMRHRIPIFCGASSSGCATEFFGVTV